MAVKWCRSCKAIRATVTPSMPTRGGERCMTCRSGDLVGQGWFWKEGTAAHYFDQIDAPPVCGHRLWVREDRQLVERIEPGQDCGSCQRVLNSRNLVSFQAEEVLTQAVIHGEPVQVVDPSGAQADDHFRDDFDKAEERALLLELD